MRFALLPLVFALAAPALARENTTMKDLAKLEKKEAWEEIIARALDVPPADREDEWDDIVVKAASGRLDELEATDLESLAYTKARIDADRKAFPHLKKAKAYKHAANEVMVKSFKACYQSRECKTGTDIDWLIMVNKFVKDNKDDAVAACDAGQMIQSMMVAYTALPSYAAAVAKSNACCKVKEVKAAVAEGRKNADYKDEVAAVAKACKL